MLGLLIVISATIIIVCIYQRRKKQKLNVSTEHIYDVPDYAKIELRIKNSLAGSQQVSCETEANVAYGNSCDVETNIAYGLGGCSIPQQSQTSTGETDADTEESTEINSIYVNIAT